MTTHQASNKIPSFERLESRLFLSAGVLDPSFGIGGVTATEIDARYAGHASAIATRPDGSMVVAGEFDGGTAFLLWLKPDGTPDTTKAFGGRESYYEIGEPRAVAIQPDGKVLVVADSGSSSANVLRIDSAGYRDQTFGDYGIARVDIPYQRSSISAMVVLPDGRILLGGRSVFGNFSIGEEDQDDQGVLVQLLPNGQVDPAFGSSGGVYFSFGLGTSVRAMAVATDGKALIAGRASGDFYLAKLDATGEFDPSFGTAQGGWVTFDLGANDDEPFAVTVLRNQGGIVLAGKSNGDFAAAAFTPAGAVRTNFGDHGKLIANIGSPLDVARGVVQTSDGGFLIIGTTSNPGAGTVRVASLRLTARGKLSLAVGSRGRTLLNLGGGKQSIAAAAASTPDGKAVVVGNAGPRLDGDALIVRLASSGAPDPAFGPAKNGGGAVPWLDPAYLQSASTARQADGKILVATVDSGPTPGNIAITRFNTDGSLDLNFGIKGTAFANIATSDGYFAATVQIAITAAGRIVLAVRRYEGTNELDVIALKADGSPDRSFAQNGQFVLPAVSGYTEPVLQTDGERILIGRNEDTSIVLYRLTANGKLDPSFDVNGRAALNLWPATPPPGAFASLNAIALAGNGRIIIAGSKGNKIDDGSSGHVNGNSQFTLIAFSGNGNLDTTFGVGGITTTNFAGAPYFGSAKAVTILPDGRIVASGSAFKDTSAIWGVLDTGSMAVAKYLSNGLPDPAFGHNGQTLVPNSQSWSSLVDMAVRPNGKILLADFGAPNLSITRQLTANGTPDPTYGNGGPVLENTGYPGSSPVFGHLILLPSGQFVNGGTTFLGDLFLERFLADSDNAFSVTIDQGVLHVTGTIGDDKIIVTRNPRTRMIEVQGVSQTFDPTLFNRVEITALNGDDQIILSGLDLPATVDAGDGNDQIFGGSASDTLSGGTGDDTIFGGGGNDTLRGGDGNDYLNGGPGADQIFGENGNDQFFALDNQIDILSGGPGFDRSKNDTKDLLNQIEALLG